MWDRQTLCPRRSTKQDQPEKVLLNNNQTLETSNLEDEEKRKFLPPLNKNLQITDIPVHRSLMNIQIQNSIDNLSRQKSASCDLEPRGHV